MQSTSPALRHHIGLCFALAVLCFSAQAQTANTSIYTDINDKTCRVVLEDNDKEFSESLCKGVAGYQLQRHQDFGDSSEVLGVRAPNGKVHALTPLAAADHAGFASYLGAKAEWRMAGGKPVALIVRNTVVPDLMNASKTVSYLVVSKITPQRICVTDVVPPMSEANARAAELADQAAENPCMH